MRAIILLALAFFPAVARADVSMQVKLKRTTYWRGETVHAVVTCTSDAGKTPPSHVRADLGGLVDATAHVPSLSPNELFEIPVTLTTQSVRSGQTYPLTVSLYHGPAQPDDAYSTLEPLATQSATLSVVRPPDSDRLNVWQWSYGGPSVILNSQHQTNAKDIGFTAAGGPVFPYSPEGADPAEQLKLYRSSLEAAMKRGMDISFCPVGIWHREYNLVQPRGTMPLVEPSGEDENAHPTVHPDDDTRYQGAARNGHEYFNPFHPEVALQQTYANELMLRELGDFPNLKYAFVDAEFVDDLYYHNTNEGGLKLLEERLGFTREEIGDPEFVAPGVLADDDRGLRYRRFVLQEGNGVNLALQRAADAVHRHRPDVQFLSDPFRSAALLDMFPGCDIISTWTYTNPDPKLMLYIETLRAVCKPAGQEPLHVVTLLNYPGSVVPEEHDENWMMMGPGRLIETTWINLSRAPEVVGYYAFDSYYKSELAFSQPSMDALAELSREVFVPYGPLLRRLEVAPRRIALLSSEASRWYGSSPGLLGYPNYQPYHFYTVMEMAHLNADVLFDETIERYGLDAYDVLVLPKCDVLTESVYNQVREFQARGGIVIADQYLGPDLPEALRFDFDFTHRRKVSANAIATGKIYTGAGEDDHIIPGKSEMENVTGVTALQDQLILESYATQLREELAGKVEPDVWCDQHDVLVNVLEQHGVQYLVLINDKRTYDDRTGPFKAVMEELVPQTASVHFRRDEFPEAAVLYDILAKQSLEMTEADGVVSFEVELGHLGGTIIALSPQPIESMTLDAPNAMHRDADNRIRVRVVDPSNRTIRGVQPLEITVTDPSGKETEFSHHSCAENGRYEFTLHPALNDPPGRWTITINDLTAGRSATHEFELTGDQQTGPTPGTQ
ncbi:MAG: hypothetical protein DWQ41_27255 [Planctomycetota bacterium]|nr:MAG: hypothetical protein DWQ41_27255 [Planctomycetota bacterium]